MNTVLENAEKEKRGNAEKTSSFPNSIWKRTCLGNSIALLVLLLVGLTAQAAIPDLWPPNIAALKPPELEKQITALASAPLPPELKPAAQFQITFLKTLSSRESKTQPSEPAWVNELRTFIAADRENDPVAHGVAEVARTWLARAQMQKIDVLLRQYYRQNVRFPDTFASIEQSLPEPLKLDPWGQPWIYQPHAPQGLAKLSSQRYQLGPSSRSALTPFGEATSNRNLALPVWKFTPRSLGNARALEIRVGAATATLQPGGKTGDYTLLYLGDAWALFAGLDQLFAVSF